MLLVGLISLCVSLAYAARWYVPLLFGDNYVDAIPVAQIMSFIIFPQILGHFLVTKAIVHEDSIFYQRVVYLKQSIYLALLFPVIYQYKEIGAAFLVVGIATLNLTLHAIYYAVRAKQS